MTTRLVVLSVVLVSCAEERSLPLHGSNQMPVVQGTNGTPEEPATGVVGGTPGGPVDAAMIEAQCAQGLGDRLAVGSFDEMRAALVGRWALCTPKGLFGRPQAGLEIGADDRYVFLSRSGDTLVPQAGLENKGSIAFVDTSLFNGPGSVQVNFESDLGFTIISHPVFSDVPRVVVINNNGVEEYRYLALPR